MTALPLSAAGRQPTGDGDLPSAHALAEGWQVIKQVCAQSTERTQRIQALTERWHELKQARVQSAARERRIRALTERWNEIRLARMQCAAGDGRANERTVDLESVSAVRPVEIDLRRLAESDLARIRKTDAIAKSAFLANVSEEICMPMNGVIGMATLLLATPLNPEQTELVQTLRQSSTALLTIINDILDFSKIEAGPLTGESFASDPAGRFGPQSDSLPVSQVA